MNRPFDVCIRGAGIVGRTMALQLASKRLRVAVIEQGPANNGSALAGHSDVRAYALNAPSKSLLEGLRCWPDAQHATPVLGMQVFGDTDGSVAFDAASQQTPALNWIVDVPVLEQLLEAAVRFQSQIQVLSEPVAAPLTVVCEGLRSSTRAEFGVDFKSHFYAQHALAARVVSSQNHEAIARQWFNNVHGETEIVALLPTSPSSYALVWSMSPARAQALAALDDVAFEAELLSASRATLGSLQLQSKRHVWPLQHGSANHWTGTVQSLTSPPLKTLPTWVLAGDSAHAVHPLAGQGLNLGLGDVAALARILDSRASWRGVGDLQLLRQYERERKAEFALIGGAGDALQTLFTATPPLIGMLRNWGMRGFDALGPLKTRIAQRAMGLL